MRCVPSFIPVFLVRILKAHFQQRKTSAPHHSIPILRSKGFLVSLHGHVMNILQQSGELSNMNVYISTIIVAIFIAILFSCSGRRRTLKPPPGPPPSPKTVQLGNMTADELLKYDGTHSEMPLLMVCQHGVLATSQF